MTSTPVKDAASFLYFGGGRAVTGAGGVAGSTAGFGSVMNKASSNGRESRDSLKAAAAARKDEPYGHREVSKTGSNPRKIKEPAKPSKEQLDAVEEAGERLVSETAEKLGVTEEEVKEAMELLGLSYSSLFDAENMMKLSLALSGEMDAAALLTDGGLYSTVQELIQSAQAAKEGLMKELSLSSEELAKLLQTAEAMKELPQDGLPENLPQTDGELAKQQTEGTDTVKTNPEITVEVEQNGETVTLTADEKGNVKQVETVNNEEAAQASQSESRVKENGKQNPESGAGGKNSRDGSMQTGNPLLDALLQNKAQAAEVSFEQTAAYMNQDTEKIMNQIMDYMKIQLKPGMDSLEMQLHPESLGTLHIQLTAKGGEVTAQFHVQNETVKAAIESQVAELKETLREQGVKVEAVEVTVESHGFESNLWQGEGKDADNFSQNRKKTPRRINLNELDALFEEQAGEEEQLAAKMMEASGNTVDYTA